MVIDSTKDSVSLSAVDWSRACQDFDGDLVCFFMLVAMLRVDLGRVNRGRAGDRGDGGNIEGLRCV